MCSQRLRKLFKAMKTYTLSDLNEASVLKALNAWRNSTSISLGTTNHYIGLAKAFTKWLIRERQLRDDPFIGLRKQNAKTDRRRVRRAFNEDELRRLLRDTQISLKRYRGSDWQFLPADRVMLYTLAASTGLRAKELSSLSLTDFDFTTMTLTVDASNTKNKRVARLPLSAHVCETLQAWIEKRRIVDKLFHGSWNAVRMAGKMLKRDLKRCGIPSVDDQGRTLDFHSLRYTFISNLARGGVHPAKAQRLARHSDINLTMSVYTSLDVDELRDAVDTLPRL